MYEEVLAAQAAQLGPAHADTLLTLAALLHDGTMGERAEARRFNLSEDVLAGQMAQLGPAHVGTLLTKDNLADGAVVGVGGELAATLAWASTATPGCRGWCRFDLKMTKLDVPLY